MNVQELNRVDLAMTIMSTSDPTGGDKVVYFGVININDNGRTVGAVDIWRSILTKEIFCEEKRLGVLDIADYIGMPKIESNKKWAVAIHRKRSGKDRWKLIKIISEGKFNFTDTDDETEIEVNVSNYSIVDDYWWSFLVEKNVNRSIETSNERNAK
jgi:hypothetical protein